MVSVVVAMSTVQHLREVIQERLTTAAEEIFSEFAKTIVRYEEEISQLRLLNIRPGIKSHNTVTICLCPFVGHEGLDEQQVCDQERSSSLNQEDPEPPQTKEEQEEICSSEAGEQLELKQKDESIHVWTGEELDLLCKPGVELTRMGLDDQQVCDQERSASLHQQDPEPPQTREEQEEICSSEEGEQLELKQEAEGINVWTGEEVDLLWKSGVKLTTVDLPQQHNCKENEDLDDPQVCSQERNPSLNQEDPEQEEMYTNQEGEQLARNQETKGIVVWTGQELGIMWNPEVKLNRIDLSPHDCKDEGGLTDQQVCNRKNNSTLDQEDPSQIKGEQEKLSTTQEGKPLVQKQETGTFSACKESDHSEPGPSSDQLLSHNSPHTDQDERKDDNSHSIQSAQIVSGLTVQNSKTAHLCSTYGKKCNSKPNLNQHIQIHKGGKPHSCSTCGKRFHYNSDLTRHIKTHTGEKQYSCSTCGKRFNLKSSLESHITIHTGEKPYTCSTYGERVRLNTQLKGHMQIHTGEMPYSCSTCGKGFHFKSRLKSHITIHTGEKPYSCSTCGERFRLNLQLKRHATSHR
ncbi:zinc finger protein 226-like isoform X1 [Simochromis diagramma]|uniref:zinc finger protein 226-like isoform X1 n=1 Tax=Simochromis diagramma TaxID=43689 RepID=UPI001A7EEA13|nr:zinc finger protein 226-like isoform X1 [Simochromis diagramma]